MLTFLGIADRYKPKWVVWENVPGVLSSNGGRDFGTFLAALGELGYGWAYRVLDAQWFGVAQRRRRVFVVGCLGDQRGAAALLFERESVSRHPAPSREARQRLATNTEASVGAGSWWNGEDLAGTLTKQNANGAQRMPDKDNFGAVLMRQREGKDGGGKGPLISEEKSLTLATSNDQVLAQPVAFDVYNQQETGEVSKVVASRSDADTASIVFQAVAEVGPTIGSSGPPYSRTGNERVETDALAICAMQVRRLTPGLNPTCSQGGTTVMQPIAFKPGQSAAARSLGAQVDIACTLEGGGGGNNKQAIAQPVAYGIDGEQNCSEELIGTLRSHQSGGYEGARVAQPVAIDTYNQTVTGDTTQTLCSRGDTPGGNAHLVPAVQTAMQVRRLTPVECERLQGFPIVRQMLYIAVCLDQASGSVDVALRCHRLQSNVWPADASELMQFAATAEGHSSTPQVSQDPLALVRVLMHSEAKVQELHSAGKLIWSVKSAEGQSECRQPTQVETIAHALARHSHVVVKEAIDGKVGSQQSISGSSHQKNGEVCVTLSIAGTKANASDATNDHHGDRPQFTTSELGQVIPKEDSTLATALCSVLHAIAGSIPVQTLPENFSIAIEVGRGYTNIPWRKKAEAPDGPRYKALGNSMAVPVMRWIGERINKQPC